MPVETYPDAVEYGVLGSLEILGPRGRVELRGARERLLLAHLLAAGGRAVGASVLVDGLWGDDPPRTAGKALQNIVLRVRRALEPERSGPSRLLVTERGGYRLVVEPLGVDAWRFEATVRSAGAQRAAARATTLREALDLWRGDAYAEFTDAPLVVAEARRLAELRVTALEDWGEAELEAGRQGDLVAELERHLVAHPLRERLWALLVRALYRQGRQGEALAALTRARSVLATELGVDPGPQLRELHEWVLVHDPRLGRPRTPGAVPPELARPDGALVGRDGEMSVLHELWEGAVRRSGQQVRVALRGPVGAGARRLAAELAHDLAATGTEVAFAGSDRPDRLLASAPDEPVLVVVDRGASEPDLGARPALVVRLETVADSPAEPGGVVVLDLAPLDRGTVGRLVASLVPPALVAEVLDEVWPESDGLPGRAHRLALAAVRQRVADEVRAAVNRAGSAATTLAEARDAVTTGVLRLEDTGPDQGAQPVRPAGTSPWPGLRAYGSGDAAWFAGRERLVAEMLARLPACRSLAVVGASGSGKSSVVHAGLVAALRDGRLPGSAGWATMNMRPGSRPLAELARVLLDAGRPQVGDLLEQLVRAPDGSADRSVLVVDQFEECWTECRDGAERAGFLDVLAGLLTDPLGRTTLVVVVRADFLAHIAEHRTLAAALADNTVLVGTPTADEVRRAITTPAQRAGLVLEDGLVDAIVADAGNEPGLLPLLSTSLRRLWDERDESVLRLGPYVAEGGLRGAIARLAEAEYAELGPALQAEARALFLRLAGPADDMDVVRRRVRLEELEGLPHDVFPLVDMLSDARLITVSHGFVEVAHEALFREWPRLQEWLNEDRDGRALQRRLATAALEWQEEGRDPALLWSGPRLEAVTDLAGRRREELTGLEHAFVGAAREAAAAREDAAAERAAAEARQNRRLRLVLVATVGVLVVAVVAGIVALRARDREASAARAATEATVAADAKRLAASALSIQQPDLALLTAVEATRLERSPETYGAVLTLLGRQPDVVTRVAAPSRLMAVAADPRGRHVYLAQEEPELWALDAMSGERAWTHDLDAMGISIAPSSDGRRLAVLVTDRSLVVPDHVAVLDRQGEEQWRVTIDQVNDQTGARDPYLWSNPTWRRDGTLVLATDSHVVVVSGGGSVVRAVPWPRTVRDTATFAVWPDGRVSTSASEAGPGVVMDLDRARGRVATTRDTLWAVSPDAGVVAATRDGVAGTELVVLDADTLRPRGAAWPVDGVVSYVRFSPDGTKLVAGVDERTEIRDGRSGALLTTLTGQSSDALGADWAGPGGERVWTAGREGTAVSFDVTGEHGVLATTRSPDRPWAGEGARDVDVEVWSNRDDYAPNAAFLRRRLDARGVRLPLTGLEDCRCEVTSTDVTSDGRTALAGVRALRPDWREVGGRGYVVAWDVATRRVRAVVETPWPVNAVDSSPVGDVAVLNGGAGWGVLELSTLTLERTGQLPRWSRFGFGTSMVEVAPDGARAVLLRGPDALVVEVATGRVVADRTVETDPAGSLQAAAWSDDETIAVGASTGWFRVLRADTLAPVAPRRLLTGGPVGDIEVSPDGRVAATIEGADGDVTLWDTSTWRPYGQAVVRDHGVGFLRFAPDSSELHVVYGAGLRARVAAEPAEWVAAACEAANRELSADEAAVLDLDRSGATCESR